MRKKLTAIIMACLMLVISVPVFGAAIPYAASENRVQEEIAELRELVQMLMLLLENQQPAASNAQITIERATEIALAHTGPGIVGTIMLFRQDGVLTYEVNVTTTAASYTIYIDAFTGVITGNNRELIAIWQPPTPVTAPPQPTWTPAPGSSSPSPGSPSSSRPTGR